MVMCLLQKWNTGKSLDVSLQSFVTETHGNHKLQWLDNQRNVWRKSYVLEQPGSVYTHVVTTLFGN